jgi:SAM-dependent methyltransferase
MTGAAAAGPDRTTTTAPASPSVDESIARSLAADPVLLPVLDYLLQDVDLLGGDPEAVVAMLRPLAGRTARTVLDLGCGKGAIAAALARDSGFLVTGIDAYQPFIDDAQRRAGAMQVADRCLFHVADMRHLPGRLPRFDVVLLVACGPVWGGIGDTLAALLELVRPGGHVVVDSSVDAGGGGAAGHEEMLDAVAVAGGRMVDCRHGRSPASAEAVTDAARFIERRARELMRLYPGLGGSMWEYVAARRAAAMTLSTPTLWLAATAT